MTNLKRVFTTSSILSLAVLTACSSSKDASESNFTDIINKYHENNCISISVNVDSNEMPIAINVNKNSTEVQEKLAKLNSLVKVGLLDVADGTREFEKNRTFNKEKVIAPAKIYTLTSKGKDSFGTLKKGSFGSDSAEFCIANYTVESIKHFSEPSQAMGGFTISRVSYKSTPDNIVDWINSDIIKTNFSNIKNIINNDVEMKAILVLMNDGWVHHKDADL